MTMERVKAQRRDEELAAAEVLGGEVEFFDCGDYPLNFTHQPTCVPPAGVPFGEAARQADRDRKPPYQGSL